MVVAGGAAGGEAEPDGGGRLNAVDRVSHIVFIVDRTALAGGDVAAVEPGRDPLIEGRLGQEVAGELFNSELVKGLVAVEGIDDPVPVGPERSFIIQVQAMGVAVAGRIQPEARHVLAVLGGSQQAGDNPLVGLIRFVGEELIDFL